MELNIQAVVDNMANEVGRLRADCIVKDVFIEQLQAENTALRRQLLEFADTNSEPARPPLIAVPDGEE